MSRKRKSGQTPVRRVEPVEEVPQPAPHKCRVAWWAVAILLLSGLAAYSNSFSGKFLFDDQHVILDSPFIRTLFPIDRRMWGTRPVGNLSFAVNYVLCGARPLGYHVFNLAVHLTAALALLAQYQWISPTGSARVRLPGICR